MPPALTRLMVLAALAGFACPVAGALAQPPAEAPLARPRPEAGAGRAELGGPFLRNFSVKDYGAFYQNWCVVQDPRGLIYVGNNSGVLEFDGIRWRLIRTRKGTLVRSLAVDADGRVYVGAKGEFGYLAPDARGDRQFVSLMDRVDPADQTISDVYAIRILGDAVYFQSFERLFRVTRARVQVWKPAGVFQIADAVRERLYVLDSGRGLLRLEGEALEPVPGTDRYPVERLRVLLPWDGPGAGRDGMLIATQKEGLFIHDGRSLKPFATEADPAMREDQV